MWRERGRYEEYGKEMMRIKESKKSEMILGKKKEEMVKDILS